jgi:ubiquinone/menaquinone biosynthesis C-methylase UbiE
VIDSTASIVSPAVPAHFRKDAPQNPHQRRRHRAVLALLDGLPGRVLDYGCGYGDLTHAISRTNSDVVGVDVAPDRIEFARSEYAPLRFEVCPEQGLDFPAASFDIVASIVVLPFVPDPDVYLADVRRVLRPGGHLIIATKTWPLLRRIWRRVRGERDARRGQIVRHLHTLETTVALLEAHGFTVLRREAFYDPPFTNLKNPADFLNSIVEFVSESLRLKSAAPYPLLLARREPD